ncbi:MAG: amidohydrolase [Planctomycetota bacterium]|nr:amidohydrolase [Planctomycetota bacterium]
MSTTTAPDPSPLIDADLPRLRELRRDLHQHPELSMHERRTSEVVQRELRACGIEIKAGLGGGTGVLGYLPPTRGDGATTIALRADMDALPIEERTGKPYASRTPGVMHACGHDGHTTILLGVAKVLSRLPVRERGVTFVFQPAEEDGGGAEKMCREGVLAGAAGGGLGTPVTRMYGLHAWPTVQVGKAATRVGPLMASTDDFVVTVKGRQCHGAYPHFGADPIVAAAHIITALQTVASRNVAPIDSTVVTVGQINAGTANNIIPETCTLVGTVRALRADTRRLAKERFFAIVEGAARALGCEARIEWNEGYPVTENEPDATERFFTIARDVLGGDRVEKVEHATMGGEDFAYYGKHVPACFFFLGLRPSNATTYPTLHQADFDFNDDALPIGIELMCNLALRG